MSTAAIRKKRKEFHEISPYCRKCGTLTELPNSKLSSLDRQGIPIPHMATIQHNRFPTDPLYNEDITLWCRKCNEDDNQYKIKNNLTVNHPKGKQIISYKKIHKQLIANLNNFGYSKKKIPNGYYQLGNDVVKIKRAVGGYKIIDYGNIIDFKLKQLEKYFAVKYGKSINFNITFDNWFNSKFQWRSQN